MELTRLYLLTYFLHMYCIYTYCMSYVIYASQSVSSPIIKISLFPTPRSFTHQQIFGRRIIGFLGIKIGLTRGHPCILAFFLRLVSIFQCHNYCTTLPGGFLFNECLDIFIQNPSKSNKKPLGTFNSSWKGCISRYLRQNEPLMCRTLKILHQLLCCAWTGRP